MERSNKTKLKLVISFIVLLAIPGALPIAFIAFAKKYRKNKNEVI